MGNTPDKPIYVIWDAKNPSDEEDEGSFNGGFIRDQIRANIEERTGLVLENYPLGKTNEEPEQGD